MKDCFVLIMLILLSGCIKDDNNQDPAYTDFHDTLLIPDGINFPTSFDFDLDKDDHIDISIEIKEGYAAQSSFDSYIQIDTENNWEILYSSIIDTSYQWSPNAPDTSYHYHSELMPKINNVGEIININENFTRDSIMLVYVEVPHPMVRPYSKGISRTQWVGIGYRYIAFRNKTENKLLWLKVDVLQPTEIKISSCSYTNAAEISINDY